MIFLSRLLRMLQEAGAESSDTTDAMGLAMSMAIELQEVDNVLGAGILRLVLRKGER